MHVAIDDASRLAYTELLPNERKESATAFLIRALGWFERHGVTVARVMTDNGSCYRSKLFRETCAAAEARHLRTKPYTPRTNGKAERFIDLPARMGLCGGLPDLRRAGRHHADRLAAQQPPPPSPPSAANHPSAD